MSAIQTKRDGALLVRLAPVEPPLSSGSPARLAETTLPEVGFVLGQSSNGLVFFAGKRTAPTASSSSSSSLGPMGELSGVSFLRDLRAVVGGVAGRKCFLRGVLGTRLVSSGAASSISVSASSSVAEGSGDEDLGGGKRSRGVIADRVKGRRLGPSARRRRSWLVRDVELSSDELLAERLSKRRKIFLPRLEGSMSALDLESCMK